MIRISQIRMSACITLQRALCNTVVSRLLNFSGIIFISTLFSQRISQHHLKLAAVFIIIMMCQRTPFISSVYTIFIFRLSRSKSHRFAKTSVCSFRIHRRFPQFFTVIIILVINIFRFSGLRIFPLNRYFSVKNAPQIIACFAHFIFSPFYELQNMY